MTTAGAKPLRVLLVEDDADVSEAITVALELFEISVTHAGHGEAALALLRQGLRPSVILLDLMMPVMDGFEFRKLQLADPSLADIPVLVLTAHAGAEEADSDFRAAAWLRKPVRISVLLEAIRAAA